MDKLENRVKKL